MWYFTIFLIYSNLSLIKLSKKFLYFKDLITLDFIELINQKPIKCSGNF